MVDIVNQINRVHRAVGTAHTSAGEARSVLLRRDYDATVEDVWDACTDPVRISRWFLPVSGDLRLGGRYQLEGNAGGEILHCEPPHLLRVSWVFGENPPSEVEVRLSPAADGGTTFELEHIAVVDPALWPRFGPGAVGVGWDLGLLGLGPHLKGQVAIADPEEWQRSAEAAEFITRSSAAWGAAHEASGADHVTAQDAARNTRAFYTGVPLESG